MTRCWLAEGVGFRSRLGTADLSIAVEMTKGRWVIYRKGCGRKSMQIPFSTLLCRKYPTVKPIFIPLKIQDRLSAAL
jgi:hypothetical protein